MAIEIVDFPIKNGGSFHGKMLVHQRVPLRWSLCQTIARMIPVMIPSDDPHLILGECHITLWLSMWLWKSYYEKVTETSSHPIIQDPIDPIAIKIY